MSELIPNGEPVTVPVPAPAFTTSNLPRGVNVAVTLFAAFMVTTHGPVPEHHPPDQPVKALPASGVAVRVTVVLLV